MPVVCTLPDMHVFSAHVFVPLHLKNKPEMVNAPEGLNQVILRKVRKFEYFIS